MSTVNVRYIVENVDEAIKFYTTHLNFEVQLHPSPGFAALTRDDLRLLLNAPEAGGSGQAMPDGTYPTPGGWNRIQIPVEDLVAAVEQLERSGRSFRNEITVGNGGKQILLEDPSGNPIEVFEPQQKWKDGID